jgi:hypothetical protein
VIEEPRPEEEPPPLPEDEWIPPEEHPEDTTNTPEPGATEAGEVVPGVEAIPEIVQRLDSVEELTAYLYEELSNYPAGGPWFWKELNPQQLHDLWVELDVFVTWLQNRILCHWSNSEGWVAPCWYLHPDAVELLTALMVAHKAAYRAKSKKPGFGLTEWFTRGLWPTMEAFARRSTFRNCLGEREHRAPAGGTVLEESSPEFLSFVAADSAAAAPVAAQASEEGPHV